MEAGYIKCRGCGQQQRGAVICSACGASLAQANAGQPKYTPAGIVAIGAGLGFAALFAYLTIKSGGFDSGAGADRSQRGGVFAHDTVGCASEGGLSRFEAAPKGDSPGTFRIAIANGCIPILSPSPWEMIDRGSPYSLVTAYPEANTPRRVWVRTSALR